MMEPKRLRDRVTDLETEMVEVRGIANRAATDAADAHVRLKADLSLLKALRETQIEHGEQMRRGFADMRAEMRTGFAEMRTGFAKAALGYEAITQLLTDHINSCEQPGKG